MPYIRHLRGTLTEKTPAGIIIECGGVGYGLTVPLSTFDRLPAVGEEATLRVAHVIREDDQLLFGFATERERGGSLAQAVYYPVARNNARLRVDMQSIADDARPARIAGESRYLPVSRNAAARDFSYNIVYQFECGFHLNHPKLF